MVMRGRRFGFGGRRVEVWLGWMCLDYHIEKGA